MSNPEKSVFVSAYVEQDDGQLLFVDADEFNEGWTVQLRTATPDDDYAPFDIDDQVFVADQAAALRTANTMARQHGCAVIEN